jgi:hypothetical protein
MSTTWAVAYSAIESGGKASSWSSGHKAKNYRMPWQNEEENGMICVRMFNMWNQGVK